MVYELTMILSFFIENKRYSAANRLGMFETRQECLIVKHALEDHGLKNNKVQLYMQDAHINGVLVTCDEVD